MSCIRSCYDKDSSNFEHDDCKTCIHGDRPQQRTWVGLTDEEKADIAAQGHQRWKEYAEAIEAKLKAKNERKEKNT